MAGDMATQSILTSGGGDWIEIEIVVIERNWLLEGSSRCLPGSDNA